MNINEARQLTLDARSPKGITFERAIRYQLECVEEGARRGEYYYYHNTLHPDIEVLLEFIVRYGYRVFLYQKKGNDKPYATLCTGYPAWFIYWGESTNPLPEINIGTLSKNEWYYELEANK